LSEERTTKQILEEKLRGHARMPIYNVDALKKIEERFKSWVNVRLKDEDRKNWFATHQTMLGSEIKKGLLYTPIDVANLDYMEDLGFPGEEPFTRGIHPNMYRGRLFTVRQLAGFGGPEDTNQRIKFLLAHGATGVNIVFDLPTIQMYDSDDKFSRGQVGCCGVAIDSVKDMEILFDGIPIDKISVSLVTHYPTNTAILFAMYLVAAERRGVPWEKLTGTVQNDFIMEEVVRGGIEYLPPKWVFKTQCDNIEFIRKNVPMWNFITYNGYNLREAGTSAILEAAVAVANAIETLKELTKRGYDVDWVVERLAFFWDIANDFFDEVCKIRAVRRLWYRIMKYRFDAKNPRSMWMRCHAQTSGICLTREEPLNNIIRAAYHALAAVLGGVQSLHVDSYDEAYSVPTEEAALLSLRTQEIIQSEIGVTGVVDPLGGSFYVEALTNEFEQKILDQVDEIEKMGGIVKAVESGWLHKTIADYTYKEKRKIEEGTIKVVGVNYLKVKDIKPPEINVFCYPVGVEERQRKKLEKLRKERDNKQVEECLEELKKAASRGEPIIPYCVEAARAMATEGEMFKALKEAWGLWKPPLAWG